MKNLGERIYMLRTKNAMSQGDLAEKLDVSRQTVSKWENSMSVPEIDKLLALSNIFGVSIDYIVKGEKIQEEINHDNEPSFLCENEKTTERKTITINGNERYISALSLALGIICTFDLLFSMFAGYLTAINVPSVSQSLFGLWLAVSIFLCAAFFIRKEKIIALALSVKGVYALADFVIGFMGETDGLLFSEIIWCIIAVLFPIFYILSDKKNSKLFCIILCICLGVEFFARCGEFYINLMNFYDNMSRMNAILSTLSYCLFPFFKLIINIGIAVLIYFKGNPLPIYEISEDDIAPKSEMCVSMVKHIFLSLFTLGIYNCVWIYKTTENLNFSDEKEKQNPVSKLLLCIFLPFYIVYWHYSQARRLEMAMRKKNYPCGDFSVVTLILAIFVPVASSILLQVKINEFSQRI